MAVYTHFAGEALAALIAQYPVGPLVSAKGIAEGVSNSNWLVEAGGEGDVPPERYILTVYEKRTRLEDLPFFLALLDHLAAKGCPVPATIHDRTGAPFRMVDPGSGGDAGGKAAALIEYLPGLSVTQPDVAQARAAGRALAQIHLAAADFPQDRANDLGPQAWSAMLRASSPSALQDIDPRLPGFIRSHGREVADNWPTDLPTTIAHTDLFPDNVLFRGDAVSGLIDFYFAARDFAAYDLAVTHAAWSFDAQNVYRPAIGAALVEGYDGVRRLDHAERAALPVLARGACLRFVATRVEDWLATPDDALVRRKDPMEFAARAEHYAASGNAAFASPV